MARFEVTLSGGETILVDHAAPDIADLLIDLETRRFVVFSEVKGGPSAANRQIAVSTAQIIALRPLVEGSTQGSAFRPKR